MFFPSVELIFDSSKFDSFYVLDWCIYGGCIPTKLSCYVIECFDVSCTTCRLRASCSTYSLLSCWQIFFTPLSCTLYCSSAYFFWCLVVALKSFSFISRLCSTFCQVFSDIHFLRFGCRPHMIGESSLWVPRLMFESSSCKFSSMLNLFLRAL